MSPTHTTFWNDGQCAESDDEGFRNWLNEIDARIDYDVRRQISLVEWRNLFDFSYSASDACLMALTGRVR